MSLKALDSELSLNQFQLIILKLLKSSAGLQDNISKRERLHDALSIE